MKKDKLRVNLARMNNIRTKFLGFGGVIVLIMIASCQHHPDTLPILGGGGGTIDPPDTLIINPDPCDLDTVYFTNTILPLLNSSCAVADCHDAITHEDNVRLYDYSNIMQQVTPGNTGNSDLYDVITDNDPDNIMPPSPYNSLSSEQIGLIATWIQQGAKNNSCTADCDPAGFSFAQNIAPTIELACTGCHSGSNPSGSLSLTTYEQIKNIALDGRLMHSLNGTSGYTIMPDNTLGLPECNKTQFQNWVNAGAPNN